MEYVNGTLIIIKIHHKFYMEKEKNMGGYDSTREG
jgi:hypothetical protein